jgi:hypothetical protein
MTKTELDTLIDDTEAQLAAAFTAIAAGELIDLSDLLPRIETLCQTAVAQRSKGVADKLARLVSRLDELQHALQEHIAGLGGNARPDPRRAVDSYRAATPPAKRGD